MENIEENPTLNRVNELVESVRQRTRSAVDLHRRKLRSDQIDASRLNLKEFSEENVSDLAQSLKSQKHARINQLHDLSQAFLQSVDNIACFMNVTGAINVIVKELTSNCYDTQILAAECVCNLSLGTEIPCEKLAHQTTSYLLTFLRSSDERLLVWNHRLVFNFMNFVEIIFIFAANFIVDDYKFACVGRKTTKYFEKSRNYEMFAARFGTEFKWWHKRRTAWGNCCCCRWKCVEVSKLKFCSA